MEIIDQLQKKHIGQIVVVEPNLSTLDKLTLVSLDTAIERADIIVILVDHAAFKALDKNMLLDKCVVDTKGILV